MVFLSTSWSAPGRLMRPLVEGIAEEYGLSLIDLDLDEHPEFIRQYGVRNLPVLQLRYGGKIVRQWVGLHSTHEIRNGIAEAGRTVSIDK